MIKSRKLHIITCLLMMLALLLLLLSQRTTEEAITYFPPDSSISFSAVETNLNLLRETGNDQYMVKWTAGSGLDKEIYLRQDVSLLYMDGRLKGIKGLWKESVKDIELEVVFEESDSSHFQAISFHHGEIHYPNDEIKSIQRMSNDHLYVIDSPHTALESFQEPNSHMQQEWKETIDKTTSQQLQFAWKDWIDTGSIEINDYDLYPLTSIIQFQEHPISGLSQEETDRIIGQLWEGLYKNYILPIANQSKTNNQIMPLILIDKNNDHLIVLFTNEANQLETLYQQLSVEN
ncbi:hypothetical protein SAMN04487943_104161 [Gracilibacillus orientalis]|uniref:Uncharacterized protein n=1 Tax=Gracilibacillus orientalis TaxID=334253 RepID=A0A1I4KTT1_9BACI|nr:hypothetical protein [Gracilibacillus orientalis]SFL82204.1 hypothetical protein SAMN04487943_104161 [Gracilibacillus orientalis]